MSFQYLSPVLVEKANPTPISEAKVFTYEIRQPSGQELLWWRYRIVENQIGRMAYINLLTVLVASVVVVQRFW